jgi:hypothetical protein
LRGGNAVDGYASPPAYDPQLDKATDEYLEANYWGIAYLDPASWRYYLPRLIDYALRYKRDGGAMVVDAFLASLRPPDHDPPEQERVVVMVLDDLAFGDDSAWSAKAMLVLEEYWAPGALYREQR